MKRRTTWLLVALLCSSIVGVVAGQETPQVIPLDRTGLSAAQQAVLDAAIRDLERVLRDPDLASKRALGQNGWDVLDFAAYTAGSLERCGYDVAIVRRDEGTSGERGWVLVGLLVNGTTVWVPVEPLPYPTRRQASLGAIPWAGAGTARFDEEYLLFDSVVELPPNLPPIAVIRPPGRILEAEPVALFAHTSIDPDGEIVLYEWTFTGSEPETTISSSIWHTFPGVGECTVTLTVTDSRGAQASTSLVIKAVEENDCGCGRS